MGVEVPDTLFDVALAASRSLPATWQPPGNDRLLGALQGTHGRYAVSIAVVGDRLLHVKVGRDAPVPPDAAERVQLLCADANWQMPTAAFHYTPTGNGHVITQAALALERTPGVPDPAIYRNLVRECVLNAELLCLVTDAVVKGTSVEQARVFRQELFPVLYRGELGGLPAWLAPAGAPPVGTRELIDACQTAAAAAGWETARNSPKQAVVVCAGSPATGPVHSLVDVHERSLIVSSLPFGDDLNVPEDRRDAVAALLGRIMGIGTPFGLALNLETGAVAARSFLELSGVAEPPAPELLCDVIFQSAAGALLYLEPIVAVAHEGADPDEALLAHVARQQTARRTG
jgi:hypothetical protein